MTTRNATEIMKRRFGESQERRKAIEEEKARISAACLIYEARTKAGLSQAELAEKIGTSQSAISRIEDTDYDGHTLSIIHRVADALDLRLKISFEPKDKPRKAYRPRTRGFKLPARAFRIKKTYIDRP